MQKKREDQVCLYERMRRFYREIGDRKIDDRSLYSQR
ncbi:hypothetical protein CSUI_007334 [Cystoisospora suis]|uniref:Uncharacterized protein n=1 Tax=Cystoisospora suis TaxID=483139 RepID=A0A2C6KNZ3_9APIC|nr:hypothetical protein CSUI_007334 [Cystoisospora suis]